MVFHHSISVPTEAKQAFTDVMTKGVLTESVSMLDKSRILKQTPFLTGLKCALTNTKQVTRTFVNA